jgi:hypothetical protein
MNGIPTMQRISTAELLAVQGGSFLGDLLVFVGKLIQTVGEWINTR